MIHARLLGPVSVTVDGAPAPAELLWRKHLALVVYLARSPALTRSRDHLLTLLWDEKSDDAARHSLNEAIRIMRRCTGGAVDRQQQRVQLAEASVDLDVDEFERLVADNDYAAAAQLVAGEFMEGFAVPGAWEFEEWLSQERRHWRERGVFALVRHAHESLASGETRTALAAAEQALALDPASEDAARAKLNALALLGERGAALRFFEEFSACLDEQLGLAPDPQTVALVERIRAERVWTHAQEGNLPVTARRAPLAGTQRELAQLSAAWHTCARELRCGLALIAGDSGTGKTRLLEELAIRARLAGALVISARAVASDRDRPLATVHALLSAVAGMQQAQLEPVAALGGLAGAGQLLVCIDDAHHVDRETIDVLSTALRDLARRPFMLALALQPHGAPPEIEALRARIGRDFAGASVRTRLLDEAALRQLARWSLPSYDDVQIERVARRLSADSAGVAFLAVELLAAIANGLDIGQTRAAWPAPFHTLEQTLPVDLPDPVVAAIRVGFRTLSAEAQTLLAAASVLPARVSVELLTSVSGLSAADVAKALDELEWQRWLVADPRGYSFVARIAREVVARDMLTEGQRQRILAAAAAQEAALSAT